MCVFPYDCIINWATWIGSIYTKAFYITLLPSNGDIKILHYYQITLMLKLDNSVIAIDLYIYISKLNNQ